MLRGLFGQKALNRPRAADLFLRHIGQIGVAENRKAFWQQQQLRTALDGVSDQLAGALQVGGHIRAADHLYCCNLLHVSHSPRPPCYQKRGQIRRWAVSSRR